VSETTPRAETAATWIARTASAALVLLAVVRALGLGGEYYDAYETRLAARTLLGWDTGAPFPLYRSPLLVLASVVFEALGREVGWIGPALLSALAYGGLAVAVERAARRAGARAWVASTAGLLAALDLVAWGYSAHGLPDVPATAVCALVLLVADRPRPVLQGLLVGLAALCRHNVGLVGLALLAPALGAPAEARARALARVALAGAVAVGLYLVVSTLLFAWSSGSLAAGLADHLALARFERLQLAENRVRLGAAQPPLMTLRVLLRASPWPVLLAPVGARLALRRGGGPTARAALLWAAIHLVATATLAGHIEARYLLPALPALCLLAALALEAAARVAPGPWVGPAVVAAALSTTIALHAPFALRHALSPVTRGSFAAQVAREVETLRGPEGRVFWTTTHPFPVFPAVIADPGTPFPGDPFHGIYHLGPVVLAYHLERPVVLLGPAPGHPGGLRAPEDLARLVREGRLAADGSGFRPGDVLVVGTTEPGTTSSVRGAPWPPLVLGAVRAGAGGPTAGPTIELREVLPGRGW
jgi:hypothetical protein